MHRLYVTAVWHGLNVFSHVQKLCFLHCVVPDCGDMNVAYVSVWVIITSCSCVWKESLSRLDSVGTSFFVLSTNDPSSLRWMLRNDVSQDFVHLKKVLLQTTGNVQTAWVHLSGGHYGGDEQRLLTAQSHQWQLCRETKDTSVQRKEAAVVLWVSQGGRKS